MLSINPNTQPVNEQAEQLPSSSLPWIWVGFVFAFVFLVAEVFVVVAELPEQSSQLLFVGVMLGGWVYWLFCIHRLHKILEEMSEGRYPIAPGEAVGKHFIPIYNFFWVFRWPMAFTEYLHDRGRLRIMPGLLLGLMLLLSFFLRFFDGAIALASMFGIAAYISAMLRKHIVLVRGLTPDMLPPAPDKDLFGYTPPKGKDQSLTNSA